MEILYEFIYLVGFTFYVLILLLRAQLHRGILMRLGFLPPKNDFYNPIWIHAVSVGEILSVRALIDKIREHLPHKQLVLSTVTATGNSVARSLARNRDVVIYLPLDLRFIMCSVIRRIKPSIVVLVETELWPIFINCLAREKIPLVVVNGRISDRSLPRYRLLRPFVKSVLEKISCFCVQSVEEKNRLLSLGVAEPKIKVTGNMKFDINLVSKDVIEKENLLLRTELGIKKTEKVIIAASTHRGEEKILVSVYEKLIKKYPSCRLIIAPRHPQRVTYLVKWIKENTKLQVQLISQFKDKSKTIGLERKEKEDNIVFIIDTVGQLMQFYQIADIVFVGGSLVPIGGHNILEPASLAKPIVFGNYMFNFRSIAELFIKQNAAIQVKDKQEIYQVLENLINNQALARQLGSQARLLIQENQGATLLSLNCILALLENKNSAKIEK
ncbi:MAG: 3-deoxy-D-manno-octulosonic acid transferase [Candidatus Omnitrophica bacterium]|nr:3-deoxy-D-manno-octulosonic acid transferase [Candidatus Omnitrophota bacterium]